MFLLFFIIIIIIMNQILFYRVNVYLKRYYKCILFGLIILIVIILGFIYKNNKMAKNELVISKLVNNIAKVDDVYRNKKKENIENLNNEKYFGRIIIDKINVDYMVLNNYSEENLNISICKFFGDKDSNNISIIGHNYENGIFFSNLNILDKDDEIKLIIDDKIFLYKVYDKYEVISDDITPIEEENIKEITLITCNNINKKRLIIKAYLYN